MKLIDWVLACYPRGFRGRFGDDMRTACAEDYRRARSRGWLAGVLFLATTVVQSLWFGLVERLPRPATIHAFLTVDTRDAVRALAATRIVTIVSVLSLALGIGANTALFSILNSLVIKQLPVKEPGQLVSVDYRTHWSNPIWEQIRERQHDIFASAGAWAATQFNLAESGRLDPVSGAYVSGGLFQMLGVDAVAGRTVTPADDVRGGGPDGLVAVISSRFWHSDSAARRMCSGDSSRSIACGSPLLASCRRTFLGPEVGEAMDVFLPLASEATIRGRESWLDERSSWWVRDRGPPPARSNHRPGGSRAERGSSAIRAATLPLDEDADRLARYLNEAIPLYPAATGISPLRTRFEQPLTIIMMVVAAVLLIACANIANLMLARATARRHEMSVRLALGASRVRLGCQMFVESLILAVIGGLAGLAVAEFGAPLLIRQLGSDVSAATLDLSIDWRVLGFTAAAALGATLLFGLAPAFGLGGVEPNDAMKEQSRSVTGERRVGLRNALVVAQVGLSFALIVGAGLFVRTFATLATTPLGFDPSNLLIVRVDAAPEWVTPENKVAYAQRVAAAVAAAPGVARASFSRITPMSDGNTTSGVRLSGAPELPPGQGRVWMNFIEPGWFETYGMRLLAGRDFASTDSAGSEPVAVVNEAFARRFAGGRNVVGQQVTSLTPGGLNARIVGVVNDSVYRTARLGVVPTLYQPMSQDDYRESSFSVTAKLMSPRALAERDIADAIGQRGARPRIQVPRLQRSVARDGDSGAAGRVDVRLLWRAGDAAGGPRRLRRHRLLGRQATGGDRCADGARCDRRCCGAARARPYRDAVTAGAAIGIALSLWASRFVGALLFGVDARDPFTLAVAAVVLLASWTVRGWLPARNVSRLDPTTALRS